KLQQSKLQNIALRTIQFQPKATAGHDTVINFTVSAGNRLTVSNNLKLFVTDLLLGLNEPGVIESVSMNFMTHESIERAKVLTPFFKKPAPIFMFSQHAVMTIRSSLPLAKDVNEIFSSLKKIPSLSPLKDFNCVFNGNRQYTITFTWVKKDSRNNPLWKNTCKL